MEESMIEIYCGDGKGKTTAAAGLALRAVGNHIPVLFVQFMKDGSSGEIRMLRELSGVTVCGPSVFYGFTKAMNDRQKEEMKAQYEALLGMVSEALKERKQMRLKADLKKGADIDLVVVLDEVIHACNRHLLGEDALLRLMAECPAGTELVLTGRNPSKRLLEKADYISEIRKERHPFDQGVPARKGIER